MRRCFVSVAEFDWASFLQIHAGGSAVVSDLQGAAQAFLEWLRTSLDGEAQ